MPFRVLGVIRKVATLRDRRLMVKQQCDRKEDGKLFHGNYLDRFLLGELLKPQFSNSHQNLGNAQSRTDLTLSHF